MADDTDCNPSSSTVIAKPGLVQGMKVSPIMASTNVSVSWTSQDPTAGSETVYDGVTGLLSQLRQDGNYTRASCLVNNHPDTPYTDTRTLPSAGDGYYYLFRGHNTCGVGSFNPKGPSDPRAALDSATPCPF